MTNEWTLYFLHFYFRFSYEEELNYGPNLHSKMFKTSLLILIIYLKWTLFQGSIAPTTGSLVRAKKRLIEQQTVRGRAREYSCGDYVQSASLLLLSHTLLSLKLLFSLLLYPLLPFQSERRWQSSFKSSLIFSCSRLRKWNGGAGRRSHSCSESLSKPPTPQKILCSPRNTSSPSVTTATALESTIYIRQSSHLTIKARLNCQSIILHRKLPTHLLLGTFLRSAKEFGDIYHTFTPNDTQTHYSN